MAKISLKLPTTVLRQVEEAAQHDDITIGQLIRASLARDLARRQKGPGLPPPVSARLRAAIRGRVKPVMDAAQDWDSLHTALREMGFCLRATGGGLALWSWPQGQRICKASDLGYSAGALAERFGASFQAPMLKQRANPAARPDPAKTMAAVWTTRRRQPIAIARLPATECPSKDAPQTSARL
jgi:hypothetical protein